MASPKSSLYEKLEAGRQVLKLCPSHHHQQPRDHDERLKFKIYIDRLDPNDCTPDPERLLKPIFKHLLHGNGAETHLYFHPTQPVFPLDHDSQLPVGLVDLWIRIAALPRHWLLSHVHSPSLRFVYLFCTA